MLNAAQKLMPAALLALTLSAGSLWAADAKDKKDKVDSRAIAKVLDPSLVQVEYNLQFSKGQPPQGHGWSRRCASCGQYHSVGAESYVRQALVFAHRKDAHPARKRQSGRRRVGLSALGLHGQDDQSIR